MVTIKKKKPTPKSNWKNTTKIGGVTKEVTPKAKKKFNVGGVDLTKTEYQAAKGGLGFASGSGQQTDKVKEAVAAANNPKGTEPEQPQENQPEQPQENLIEVTKTIDGVDKKVMVTQEQANILQEQETMDRETQLRAEGRVSFGELPPYQQALAGAAISGPAVATFGSSKIISSSLKAAVSKSSLKTLGKLASIYTGTSGIMQWLASDNYMTGILMFSNKVADSVKWEGMDPQEALNLLAAKEDEIEFINNFSEKNTAINPALLPFRKLILSQLNSARDSFELNKIKIENVKGGTQDGE